MQKRRGSFLWRLLTNPHPLVVAANRKRREHRRPELEERELLATGAQKWAERMERRGWLQHEDGPFFEIIAKGAQTEEEVIGMWMRSRGHRNILLSERMKFVGGGRSGVYWCMRFRIEEPRA